MQWRLGSVYCRLDRSVFLSLVWSYAEIRGWVVKRKSPCTQKDSTLTTQGFAFHSLWHFQEIRSLLNTDRKKKTRAPGSGALKTFVALYLPPETSHNAPQGRRSSGLVLLGRKSQAMLSETSVAIRDTVPHPQG